MIAADIDDRVDGHPGGVVRDDHQCCALVRRGVHVGLHDGPAVFGHVGAGAPDLLAVDDEIIPVIHTGGLQRDQVGSGVRFAVGKPEPDLTGTDRREELLLELLTSDQDKGGAHNTRGYTARRDAVVRQNVSGNGRLHGRTLTSVLLGPAQTQPSLLTKHSVETLRDLLEFGLHLGHGPVASGPVHDPFVPIRRKCFLHEFLDFLPEVQFLLCESKVHLQPSIVLLRDHASMTNIRSSSLRGVSFSATISTILPAAGDLIF